MAGNKRKIQEINAGSMADISFLLLIFFLVATTMNTDTGINRVLPPWVETSETDAPPIKARNLMEVKVDRQDRILANKRIVQLNQLKDITKEFVLNQTNDENRPEKVSVEIAGLGTYAVSQGIVSLQNDRGTSYDMYIMVQNELTKAFNEVRNDVAMQTFGMPFSDLSKERREAVQKAVPLKISEAEPKNIGGN